MWSLLPRRIQLMLIILPALALAAGLEALTRHQVAPIGWTGPIVTAVGGGMVWIANRTWRWVWRAVPFLGRWAFPDLNGRWEGELLPAATNGRTDPPVTVAICVRMDLFGASVRLQSGQSRSRSARAWLERAPDGAMFSIRYLYDHEAQAQHSAINPAHEGAARLDFQLQSPEGLSGRYFTSRGSRGDIVLRRVSEDPDAPAAADDHLRPVDAGARHLETTST